MPEGRKVGRPRQEWSREMQRKSEDMLPDPVERTRCMKNAADWKRKVWTFTEIFKE